MSDADWGTWFQSLYYIKDSKCLFHLLWLYNFITVRLRLSVLHKIACYSRLIQFVPSPTNIWHFDIGCSLDRKGRFWIPTRCQ